MIGFAVAIGAALAALFLLRFRAAPAMLPPLGGVPATEAAGELDYDPGNARIPWAHNRAFYAAHVAPHYPHASLSPGQACALVARAVVLSSRLETLWVLDEVAWRGGGAHGGGDGDGGDGDGGNGDGGGDGGDDGGDGGDGGAGGSRRGAGWADSQLAERLAIVGAFAPRLTVHTPQFMAETMHSDTALQRTHYHVFLGFDDGWVQRHDLEFAVDVATGAVSGPGMMAGAATAPPAGFDLGAAQPGAFTPAPWADAAWETAIPRSIITADAAAAAPVSASRICHAVATAAVADGSAMLATITRAASAHDFVAVPGDIGLLRALWASVHVRSIDGNDPSRTASGVLVLEEVGLREAFRLRLDSWRVEWAPRP
jgi:hypothetical protein